jgi:hypothetical protein
MSKKSATRSPSHGISINERLVVLERKVEHLLKLLEGRARRQPKNATIVDRTFEDEGQLVAVDLLKVFRLMTPRQHATLQMLLADASNGEIANRLNITENGVKTHVIAIYRKLGIVKTGPHNKRRWVQELVQPYFEHLPNEEYLKLARIPKNWHCDFHKIGKQFRHVV